MADGTIRIDIDLASKTAQKEYERLVDTLENKSDEYTDTEVANMQRRRNELQKTIDQAKKLEDRRAMIEQEEKIWGSLRLEIIEAQKALEEFEATKPKTMTGEERGEFSKQRAEMQENITLLEKQVEESKKIVDTWSEVNDEFTNMEQKLWTAVSHSSKLGQETETTEKATKKLNKETAKLGRNYDKGLKSIAKYTMALFSIRSAYTLLSRLSRQWLNSTNEEAQKTTAMLSQMSNAFSNILAPAIQWVVSLLWTMFSILNSILSLFFGINLASKNLTKNTKATGSALKQNTKELNKQLAGFDEVNKLTKDDGSSGGGGADLSTPSIELGEIKGLEKLKKDLQPLLDIVADLNWEPLMASLERLGNVGKKTFGIIYDSAIRTLNEAIAPFMKIFVEETAPAGLNAIANTLDRFNPILERLLKDFVEPLFAWFMTEFVPAGLETLFSLFEALGGILAVVVESFNEFWDTAIGEAIKFIASEFLLALMEQLKDIFDEVTASVDYFIEKLKEGDPFARALAIGIGLITTALIAWKVAQVAVNTVTAIFKAMNPFTWIIVALAAVVAGILLVYKNWENVKNFFGETVQTMVAWVGGWADKIKTSIAGIVDFVKGAFKTGWTNAWNGIATVFNNIISGIANMFKTPINFVIDGLNAFIRSLNNIKIPSWVPLVGGKGINISPIRRLNTGMIISRPITTGNTVLAEGGREALLPLDSNTGWIDELADKLANSTVQTINLVVDGSVLAKVVNKQNEKEQFRTGVVYG